MAGAVHIMGKIEAPNITTPTKKSAPRNLKADLIILLSRYYYSHSIKVLHCKYSHYFLITK